MKIALAQLLGETPLLRPGTTPAPPRRSGPKPAAAERACAEKRERLEAAAAWIAQHPGQTCAAAAAAVGVEEVTMRKYLRELLRSGRVTRSSVRGFTYKAKK